MRFFDAMKRETLLAIVKNSIDFILVILNFDFSSLDKLKISWKSNISITILFPRLYISFGLKN